jgi:hypothetical protein
MRTRQPQPSWAQVSSVPASFAIDFLLIYLEPVNRGIKWTTTRAKIYPIWVFGIRKSLDRQVVGILPNQRLRVRGLDGAGGDRR